MKRTNLVRRTRLNRRTPVRPRNAKRMSARTAAAFGVQAERCRASRCVACVALGTVQQTRTVAHHAPPRSRGGLDEHTGPVCVVHHQELHNVGHERFCRMLGIDWAAVLARMQAGNLDDGPVSSVLGEGGWL